MDSQCSICLDSLTTLKRQTKQLECGCMYCRKCISAYARLQAQNHEPSFKCPNCTETFNPSGLVGSKWLHQWEKRKQALGKILCPRDRCTGEILGTTCLKCRQTICPRCLEISHNGPCQDGIAETLDYKINKTHQCPKCGVNIEKNGGCNHMKCRQCGHDFNWNQVKVKPPRTIHLPTRPKLEELEDPIPCQECKRYCLTVDSLCCSCLRRRKDVEYEPCRVCRF